MIRATNMLYHSFTKLDTGLKVIRVPMSSNRSVTAMMLVNTGSRYERVEEQGAAHFIEHLVYKGTQKYTDNLSLARKLDSVGAACNAFTSKEYTGYYVTTTDNHLKLALDVLNELLFSPLFRQEDLQREKNVIVEEIRMLDDTPSRHVSNLFERHFYQNQGLAHDISGPEKSVLQMDRQKLNDFLNDWYGLSNMTLVIAGNKQLVESMDTTSLVAEIFSKVPKERHNHRRKNIKSFLDEDAFSQQRVVLEKKDIAQTHFVLGWPALKRGHPSRYILSVLSTVVGGNRSSRLFDEIREKRGLAYYIWADLDQYHDVGLFGAQGGLNVNKTVDGLREIIGQFKAIANGQKKIKLEEVEEAKEFLIGRMILGLEDSESVARYYGLKDILLDKIEDPDLIIEKIRSVNAKQVNDLAVKLIQPGELRLALVGNFDNEDEIRSLVKQY
ncbi:MAG: pitrilysin family protein [Patescibacteria group bacterium]|nr:pitrilysin family protein [Patescibacteria group bacterium]